jgi:hypothetical protein
MLELIYVTEVPELIFLLNLYLKKMVMKKEEILHMGVIFV